MINEFKEGYLIFLKDETMIMCETEDEYEDLLQVHKGNIYLAYDNFSQFMNVVIKPIAVLGRMFMNNAGH